MAKGVGVESNRVWGLMLKTTYLKIDDRFAIVQVGTIVMKKHGKQYGSKINCHSRCWERKMIGKRGWWEGMKVDQKQALKFDYKNGSIRREEVEIISMVRSVDCLIN